MKNSLFRSYNAEKKGIWGFLGITEKFHIPVYQRDFSWGEEQINEFLDSIEQLSEEEFYLGALVISKRSAMEKDAGYEDNVESQESQYVVDGQQRLTTISLLTHCMLMRLAELHPNDNVEYFNRESMSITSGDLNLQKKCKSPYMALAFNNAINNVIPSFLLDDESLKLYQRIKLFNQKHREVWDIIFSNQDLRTRQKKYDKRSKDKILTPGDKKLWEEFNRIHERVRSWGSIRFLEYASKFFSGGENCPVHAVIISSDYLETGVNIFYGMNTKGLQLGAADLIKAKISIVAGDSFDEPKEKTNARKGYVKKWEEFEKVFDEKMNIKRANDKFRDYLLEWIVSQHHEDDYLKNPKRRIGKNTLLNAYNEDLATMVPDKRNDQYYHGIDDVLKYLENLLDIYVILSNPKKDSKAEGEDENHKFTRDFCSNANDLSDLNTSILRMNRLLDLTQHRRLVLYIFSALSDNPLAKSLTFKKNIKMITKIINLITSFMVRIKILSILPQSFRPWINGVLDDVRHVAESAHKDKVAEAVYKCIKDFFEEKILSNENLSDKEVKNIFLNKRFTATKDQKFLKSILWEIEFQQKSLMKLPDTTNEDLKQWDSYHIEHIYPQADKDSWKEYYDIDSSDQKSEDAHAQLFDSRYNAGNATLWHKNPNTSFSDSPFSKKLKEYKKEDKYIHKFIVEEKESDNDSGWTKKCISQMSERYGNMVVDILKKLSQ